VCTHARRKEKGGREVLSRVAGSRVRREGQGCMGREWRLEGLGELGQDY